jgi:hypothetical protein
MEGCKDLKIHKNINANLTPERPNSKVGTMGSLQLNTMKYNPAVISGIQLLIMVFSAIFLGNLLSYLIEDFQSDDDLSEYAVQLYSKIIFNIVRLFIPSLLICQNKGFRQFIKFSLNEFSSQFNFCISLQCSNSTQNTDVVLMLETTQGHNSLEKATLHYKNEVEKQKEEDVLTQQTVLLNTVNVELQEREPNAKPDLKNIKEIKTELGIAQDLQSVTECKGKGKGKGQSNFKKERRISTSSNEDDHDPTPAARAWRQTRHSNSRRELRGDGTHGNPEVT